AAPFGPGGPGGAAFRLGRVSHGVPFFVREGPPFRLVSRKGGPAMVRCRALPWHASSPRLMRRRRRVAGADASGEVWLFFPDATRVQSSLAVVARDPER